MRIDWFWLDNYKNLSDLTINFSQDHLITVLIGRNGTGKSNVLEALTIIFRDLLMAERIPSFKYRIAYEIRDRWVFVDADPDRKSPYRAKTISKDDQPEPYPVGALFEDLKGELISRTKLVGEDSMYLPRFLFGYYSGESERMREVFRKYLKSYDDKLIKNLDPGLKRMFFAEPVHSNFVLLSFIVNNKAQTDEFLQKQLGLEEGGIESVLFVLKQPYWYNKNATGGDARFWNSKGIVRDFLAKLYDISLAPIRVKRRELYDVRRSRELEYLYLFAKDIDALRELAQGKSSAAFFRDLESTHVSGLIDEVRIRVKLKKNDGSVTFRELSEGEQQLLTVLGLLQFTSAEASLFLLDEPDTHLNPRWSVEYLQHIRDFLKDENDKNQSSHVLLATHNPIAVAELRKEQVQILKRDDETLSISAQEPDVDPIGMGYAGVITSEMFGLNAAVDTTTQKLLEIQRILSVKSQLSEREKADLEDATSKLETLGFRYQMRDPVYTEYLKARAEKSSLKKRESDESEEALDPDETRRLVLEALKNMEDEGES
ncbi:MAG TPA: chromosome segregation protein SMC [Halomonas sp.]|jgi:predicted ATPase|uniref:AAA family ATPase n=1 Tax=Vreelandella TaxID=3137766 RepID=UPI0005CBF6B7|nr:ATP-binding protein [Halomonas meridiana]KJD18534.1 chromosome segregation protein SMC [Halomonas meridiana]HBM43764.1 chromosome segregation protein SMC [Halomonas sp.]HBP79045.1 chromosome segregation protein SMC [Halomonas sp.]|tara:strand:+ start:4883 stop:6514 length:1632 start_codon:yes stop_codon:yes gene_type:complete